MISIENYVVNSISEAIAPLLADYPSLRVGSMYVDIPTAFPYVSVEEIDNYTYQESHVDLQEEHAIVTYDVNVYANDPSLKTTAKVIADTVDAAMQNLKFTRIMSGVFPNIDRTIYRYTMRYEAIVQKGKEDGDTIIYQMYHT